MTPTLHRALDAIARGETPPRIDPADAAIVDLAQRLAAAGRSIEPPAGSFARAVAAAVIPAPRRFWMAPLLRPAMAIALSVLLAASLGTASYASTPGEPLYPVQRRLDDLYLGVPRSPADAFGAYRAAADRRVAQAAGAATRVRPDVLQSVLDDAARYLRDALAAAQRSPAGERHQLLRSLVETQRSANGLLAEAGERAGGEQRGQIGRFEESMQHDIDDVERDLEQDDGGPGGRAPATPPTETMSGGGRASGGSSGGAAGDQDGGGTAGPGDRAGDQPGSSANGSEAETGSRDPGKAGDAGDAGADGESTRQ